MRKREKRARNRNRDRIACNASRESYIVYRESEMEPRSQEDREVRKGEKNRIERSLKIENRESNTVKQEKKGRLDVNAGYRHGVIGIGVVLE